MTLVFLLFKRSNPVLELEKSRKKHPYGQIQWSNSVESPQKTSIRPNLVLEQQNKSAKSNHAAKPSPRTAKKVRKKHPYGQI